MTKTVKNEDFSAIIPVGWRVLLKPRDVSDVTAGGIIRPDITKETMKLAAVICEVIAMGPDAYGDANKFQDPWVKVGDQVLIERFAGARFKYNGEEYRILNDDEIIAVINDPDNITNV